MIKIISALAHTIRAYIDTNIIYTHTHTRARARAHTHAQAHSLSRARFLHPSLSLSLSLSLPYPLRLSLSLCFFSFHLSFNLFSFLLFSFLFFLLPPPPHPHPIFFFERGLVGVFLCSNAKIGGGGGEGGSIEIVDLKQETHHANRKVFEWATCPDKTSQPNEELALAASFLTSPASAVLAPTLRATEMRVSVGEGNLKASEV